MRVPGWCREISASLNGQPLSGTPDRHGCLVVRRRWQAGDVLEVALGLAPRFSFPNRRIDALRGTAAVERGPLVYCFEQADQADGADLEDLAIRARAGSLAEQADSVPGLGATVIIKADAVALPPVSGSAPAYPAEPAALSDGHAASAVAIPYFQWDNRDGRAMRVWMPVAQAAQDPDLDK